MEQDSSIGTKTTNLWNGKTIALISLFVVTVIAVTVFFTNKKSIYDELELTLFFISASLFAFLSYGLYSGAKIAGRPLFPQLNVVDISSLDPGIDIGFPEVGDGIAGIILSIILWFVFTIALFFLLTFLVTAAWSAVLLLAFALYWLFYRALRIVFLKSFECKGDIGLSMQYALKYSFLYTGWMFLLIRATEYYLKRT